MHNPAGNLCSPVDNSHKPVKTFAIFGVTFTKILSSLLFLDVIFSVRWRNTEDAEARYQEQEEANGGPCLQGVKDDDDVDDDDDDDDDDEDDEDDIDMLTIACLKSFKSLS